MSACLFGIRNARLKQLKTRELVSAIRMWSNTVQTYEREDGPGKKFNSFDYDMYEGHKANLIRGIAELIERKKWPR